MGSTTQVESQVSIPKQSSQLHQSGLLIRSLPLAVLTRAGIVVPFPPAVGVLAPSSASPVRFLAGSREASGSRLCQPPRHQASEESLKSSERIAIRFPTDIGHEPPSALHPRGRCPRRGHLPHRPRASFAVPFPAAQRHHPRRPRTRPTRVPSRHSCLRICVKPLPPPDESRQCEAAQ